MDALVNTALEPRNEIDSGKAPCQLARLLMFGAFICTCYPPNAQSQSAPVIDTSSQSASPPVLLMSQSLENWFNQPTMTGDWGGLRTRLSQDGFDFRASYIGEYAYSFSGGKRIGGDYAQQFAFGMDVDMGKAANLPGGTFHVSFNVREGRSTSADDIGNKIAVQEIYGDGDNFRLAELSYQQTVLNNILDLKAGFVVMGDDFGKTPVLCDFQNGAFCAHPNSLPTNSGWSDYPAGKWGGRVRVNISDDLYAETGVFDVNPTYAEHENGFKLSLQGSTGVLVPFEVGKTIKLGSSALPGHYKIGAYYDSSQVPEITNASMTESGRWGAYLLADQMVWSFEPGTDRGLILVANATISDKRTSTIPTYLTFAVVAQGALAARPHDFIALGYVRDTVNGNAISKQNALLAAQGVADPGLELGENILEVAYGLQVTPWLTIRPNVQYIGNPSAFSFKHVPDAWVFGTHLGVTF